MKIVMIQKSFLNLKYVLPIALLGIILIAGMGFVLAKRNSSINPVFPPNVYFGEPAIISDLLVRSANAKSVNLIGKWSVESINNVSVAPAADWLEEPAIVHIAFELRDDEVLLTGYSGCNGFGGQVYVLVGQLQTPEIIMTQRGCNGELLSSQESSLNRILSSPNIWQRLKIESFSQIIIGSEEIGFVQLKKLSV